jgi:hypothetical protein
VVDRPATTLAVAVVSDDKNLRPIGAKAFFL